MAEIDGYEASLPETRVSLVVVAATASVGLHIKFR